MRFLVDGFVETAAESAWFYQTDKSLRNCLMFDTKRSSHPVVQNSGHRRTSCGGFRTKLGIGVALGIILWHHARIILIPWCFVGIPCLNYYIFIVKSALGEDACAWKQTVFFRQGVLSWKLTLRWVDCVIFPQYLCHYKMCFTARNNLGMTNVSNYPVAKIYRFLDL